MAKEEEKESKEEKSKDRFQLVEVPTQTTIIIRDTEGTEEEELWDDKKVFVEILNRLDVIIKNTG